MCTLMEAYCMKTYDCPTSAILKPTMNLQMFMGAVFQDSLLSHRSLAGAKESVSEGVRHALEEAEKGAKCLSLIPAPWNERLKPLIRHPSLQLESLLMVQQFKAAMKVLQAVHGLQSRDMLLRYARYSFALAINSSILLSKLINMFSALESCNALASQSSWVIQLITQK